MVSRFPFTGGDGGGGGGGGVLGKQKLGLIIYYKNKMVCNGFAKGEVKIRIIFKRPKQINIIKKIYLY